MIMPATNGDTSRAGARYAGTPQSSTPAAEPPAWDSVASNAGPAGVTSRDQFGQRRSSRPAEHALRHSQRGPGTDHGAHGDFDQKPIAEFAKRGSLGQACLASSLMTAFSARPRTQAGHPRPRDSATPKPYPSR